MHCQLPNVHSFVVFHSSLFVVTSYYLHFPFTSAFALYYLRKLYIKNYSLKVFSLFSFCWSPSHAWNFQRTTCECLINKTSHILSVTFVFVLIVNLGDKVFGPWTTEFMQSPNWGKHIQYGSMKISGQTFYDKRKKAKLHIELEHHKY